MLKAISVESHHMSSRGIFAACLALLLTLPACFSLERTRPRDENAIIRAEAAELLKLHRLCLKKYEDDGSQAREQCSIYQDAIHDLMPPSQTSMVVKALAWILEWYVPILKYLP
jgi:hypothetical protein